MSTGLGAQSLKLKVVHFLHISVICLYMFYIVVHCYAYFIICLCICIHFYVRFMFFLCISHALHIHGVTIMVRGSEAHWRVAEAL